MLFQTPLDKSINHTANIEGRGGGGGRSELIILSARASTQRVFTVPYVLLLCCGCSFVKVSYVVGGWVSAVDVPDPTQSDLALIKFGTN